MFKFSIAGLVLCTLQKNTEKKKLSSIPLPNEEHRKISCGFAGITNNTTMQQQPGIKKPDDI